MEELEKEKTEELIKSYEMIKEFIENLEKQAKEVNE